MLCRHCLYSAGEKNIKEMTYDEIEDLINEFADLSKEEGTLNLFGGEIFLRKDVFDIIDLALSRKLKIGITTNVNLPLKIIKKISAKDINRLTIDIDGLKNTHDWLRNKKGHFQQSLKAIKYFIKAKKFVSSNIILYKNNINEIEKILKLCSKLKIKSVSFYIFTPLGRGKNIKDLVIGPVEWKMARTRIKDWIKKNNPKFSVIWERSYEYKDKLNDLRPSLCKGEPYDAIDIRCDGNVYYCGLLFSTEIGCLGNVKKNKLENILKNRKSKSIKMKFGCPAIAWNNGYRNNLKDPRDSSNDIIPICPYDWELLYSPIKNIKDRFNYIN